MKKRTLLTILLFLLIIFLVFLLIFGREDTNEIDDPANVNFESNQGEVFNQGESVLKYQDNIFLIDNLSNSIVKYNTKNDNSSVISRFNNYSYNDNMYIVNNKLLYSINNLTYFMSLDTLKSEKFTDGNLVYIDDEIYMYILQEDSLQYLYVTSYDGTSFRRTNDIFYNLAKGYKINYLKESNGLIFFSSVNSDDSTTLFSVNLENYEITLVARETNYTTDTSRGVIVDAVKFENDIYFTVANIFSTTETELISDYDLYVRPIDSTFSEFLRGNVDPYLLTIDNELIYGKFNSESDKYEWEILYEDGTFENWFKYVKGDISRYFTFEDLKLYFNGKELRTFEEIYSDFSISYATYCDEKIYILFENGSLAHVWFSFNVDGSEFNKIYETK